MSYVASNLRTNSPRWLDISSTELETLRQMAGGGTLYAVIDACCSPELPSRVVELGEQRALCLYRGHAAKNFAGQAPYLVAVDALILDWICSTLEGKDWGLFISSRSSLPELYGHLRRFLTVDSPNGERWIFRYYDPRVLPNFLAACNEAEAAEFFGRVDAFLLAHPKGVTEKLQQIPGSRHSPPLRRAGERFRLRAPHVMAFYPLVNAHVSDGLLRALREKGYSVEKSPESGDLMGRDARGFVTRLSFGADNLPNCLTLPSGTTWRFENDSSGHVRALLFPGGERLELARDERGRLVSAHQPGRSAYRFEYDSHDSLTVIHHPDATREELRYTDDGKVSAMVGRSGDIREYAYEEGRLRSAIDPLGRRTCFKWDETCGLTSIAFPDGTQEYFEYDPISRVATQITRDESFVFRQLDEKGDLETIIWADGTSTRFSVDERGCLRAAENDEARTEYVYDHSGRLASEHTVGENVAYEYDGDGRLAALSSSPGEMTRYEYDEDGRLLGISAWGQQLSIEHTPLGVMKRLCYGNGLIEEREYTRGGRTSHAFVTNAQGGYLSEQRYSYDDCERLRSVIDTAEARSFAVTRQLEYDRGSRLVRDTMSQAGGSFRDVRYAYDACGNMVQDGEVLLQTGLMDEVRFRGNTSLAYDALGQLTRLPGQKGDLECQYNADGTLQQVRSGGTVLSFAYDALGRRIHATDGQRTWRFVWAGLQLLREELSESPTTSPVRRDYLYLPEGVSPVAFRENNRVFWMQHDARGAVIRTFDDSGNIVWQASYDSFGEARVEIARIRQPWRLAGQYEDESTGLHYNLGRYYSPLVKSYLSRDPQWFRHGASAYSYCGNDPWNRADPHGQWAWIAVGAVLGAVAGGVVAAMEGKSPLEVAGAALEGAAIGAVFAVNPIAGAAVFMAADIVHQGLEQGWSNVCVACAAGKAALVLIGGVILGRVLGFLGRHIGRPLGWMGRHLGNAARQAGRAIARWARQAGQAIKRWIRPKPPPRINSQKQAGHVRGTPQYKNRIKQGKATSAFDDAETAERLTQEAWKKGKPVPGKPNVRDHEFGRRTGSGPNGGAQTRVRAHQDSKGEIHGHPSGPEGSP